MEASSEALFVVDSSKDLVVKVAIESETKQPLEPKNVKNFVKWKECAVKFFFFTFHYGFLKLEFGCDLN